jgi:A/G-specific adenine glycosylase
VIHKRPGTGLLANLWEFPNFEVGTTRSGRKQLGELIEAEFGVDASVKAGVITRIQHVFSHIIWDIEVYAGSVESTTLKDTELIAVTEEELERYAFPVSHQKIWKETKEVIK